MRRWIQCSAVLLLSVTLGLHWAALQTAAWVGMFLGHLQTESVTTAVSKTLDGEHPCRVCQFVREGRSAQRTDDATPADARGASKLEQFVRLEAVPHLEASTRIPPAYPFPPLWSARSERPSLPPPRPA